MAKKFSFDVNSDTGNEKVAYEPPRQLVQYAGACTGKYKIRKRVPITQQGTVLLDNDNRTVSSIKAT